MAKELRSGSVAPHRGALALAALAAGALLSALLAAPAALGAGEAAPVRLEYVVDASDAALRDEGKVRVVWRASGLLGPDGKNRVSAFCLHTDAHEYAVLLDTFEPQGSAAGQWEYHPPPEDVNVQQGRPPCPTGFRTIVRNLDSVQATFLLDVRKLAFSPCGCEFNSFLGPAWGVVKGEALAFAFSYSFFEPQPLFEASVSFVLPEGWSVEAPWARVGPQSFALPGGDAPLPRGFVALGPFVPELHAPEGLGKEFLYVRLAQELRDKARLFTYLEKATPYYRGVYGNVTGQRILVISAGPPMFTGGLGSTDSLFVHHNSSLETIAHEYAHVWQSFQTVDDPAQPGGSSIWANEGDADLHGLLSRFVTEVEPGLTLQRVNDELRALHEEHASKPSFQRPLSSAAYGCPEAQECNEQVAYKKGLATLLFLDRELKRLTEDRAGLNDVLRELNLEWALVVSQREGTQAKRVTNDDVLRVVNRVVQRHANVDMLEFFRLFVWGNGSMPCPTGTGARGCWPPFVAAEAEAPVVFDDLRVEPGALPPGERFTVTVRATNVRSAAETRDVELYVDERLAERRSVTLGPLQGALLTFALEAPEPGPHTARVAYLREAFRVLTPALLRVEAVEPLAAPEAGVAFELGVTVRNDGEAGARATVRAVVAGQERSAELEVPGKGTARAALPFLVMEEGSAGVEVAVRWGNGSVAASSTLRVAPRDRDADGVPDARDAYPDDPRASEPSPIHDLRRQVPGAGAGLAALALGAAALAARARRRGR